jgi:signal transduction histidine kinase
MRGVEQIYKSGRHLLNLVNEVLNIARIESGKMQISPEPVRLADTLVCTQKMSGSQRSGCTAVTKALPLAT